jgi:hypothetical protein
MLPASLFSNFTFFLRADSFMPHLSLIGRAAEMMYALDQVSVTGEDLCKLSDVPSEVCESLNQFHFKIL